MRLLHPALATAVIAFAFAGDAAAQNAAVIDVTKQPNASALRYRFTHVPDGVMRLDHQTGQVVFCKSQAAGKWLCNAVPEEGAVIKAQAQQAEPDSNKLVEQLGELQKQLNMPAEDRTALTAAIEKAQADSAAAKGELAALRAEIASLKQQLSGNQVEQTLKAEIARIRSGNEALAVELGAMRKDIAAISAQVTAQSQVEAQRAAMAKLQSENRELNDRIASLQHETATLQRRITELEPPRPPAPVPNADSGEAKAPQMPSKEDLAVARARIAEAWKRVVEMLNDLRRDLTGKNSDDSVRL